MSKAKFTYICTGRFCWGTGSTLDKAVAACRQVHGRNLTTYYVRRYPAEADPSVSGIDGSVTYKRGFESVVVEAKKNGKPVNELGGKPVVREK